MVSITINDAGTEDDGEFFPTTLIAAVVVTVAVVGVGLLVYLKNRKHKA